MTLTAFFLILASIFLHVCWNFFSKTGRPTIPFFFLFSVSIYITVLPLALCAGIPLSAIPAKVYLCAVSAGVSGGFLMDIGLSLAYRTTDISVSYPLSRALPVIFTILVTAFLGIGAPLNAMAVCGMVIIFAGCLLTGWATVTNTAMRQVVNKGITGILMVAAGVTAYTVFDSIGMNAMTEAFPDVPPLFRAARYSNIREPGAFLVLLAVSLLSSSSRRSFNRNLFLSWHPYAAGAAAGATYLLVLLAMPQVTNVSYVQAFRQMSLPIGVLAGAIFLKEKICRKHLIGIILIVIGLILSALRNG